MLFRHFASPLLAVALVGAAASAAPTFTANTPILTVLQDGSNLRGTYTAYSVGFSTDQDVYLNSFTLVPGAGYDSNISLSIPSQLYYYSGTYTPGTLIPSGSNYTFYSMVYGSGLASLAATGIYNFSVEVTGGATPDATDVLADIPLQVEVFNKLDVTGTAVATPSTISPGQSTTVSMTVTNNMTDRNFVTTEWGYYGSGMVDGLGDSLTNTSFDGNWFNTTIAPGTAETQDHTTWAATALTPNGTYNGDLFVEGGLYYGDEFDIGADPSVVVAPEPVGGAAAGLLAMVGLCYRRRVV
jgi:hypothetical protein